MMGAVKISSHDLWDLLKKLGAPDNCREFHLHVAVDKPVTVTATFFPNLEGNAQEISRTITRHYVLVESSDGADDAER
jgi:hypothetical protein